MTTSQLQAVFDDVFTVGASAATAPILALGSGVLLFLLCDIVERLKPARNFAFVATLVVSGFFCCKNLLNGGGPGPVLDGTFYVDAHTSVWGLLFLASTLMAWVYGLGYYREDKPFQPEHDALLLCAPAGMMLMVGAGDLIVFFIGLELLSLPLYALAAFRRARTESVEAGLKYFLLGSFSSALLLYGSALLYAAHGTLSIPHLLEADPGGTMALAGSALVAASLFFKVSVFPFHLWVPDVYQGAPTPVTVLMATGTKAAAFGFLLRIIGLFPEDAGFVVSAIALVTMAAGNLGALVQTDLKRMLAYSGVAHAGTMLLLVAAGMAGADEAGLTRAALFYMGAYVFTATGAFGILSLLETPERRFATLDDLRGLGREHPALAGAMTLFMLSLGGIPATGGFLGKWFVFAELVEADLIAVAVLGALLSVVALGYYLRVLVVLFMEAPGATDGAQLGPALRPTARIATWVCCFFVLLFGLAPGTFLALIA